MNFIIFFSIERIRGKLHFQRKKESKQIRRNISEFAQQIHAILNRLDQSGKPYTCDTVVELYRIGENNVSLVLLWQEKIRTQRALNKFGIANAQQYTLRSVIRFAGSEHIGIRSITPEFIQNYELIARE